MSLEYRFNEMSKEGREYFDGNDGQHGFNMCMAMMACGVTSLKAEADLEKLHTRGILLDLWNDNEKIWPIIRSLRGLFTNVSPLTDAQVARKALDAAKHHAKMSRRLAGGV